MEEEPKKVEEPRKEDELLTRLQKELREFEEHARIKQELAERKKVGAGRLLSYEEGFSWCYECKFVSTISPQSELRPKGLRGCQRPSCSKCTQWRGPVVYHDEDFLYEGEKQQKDCQWFVSGQGCEDGNKCILVHPKWDTSLKENKRRCFVCGQKNDHTSMYCTRPGGGYEGSEVAMDMGEFLVMLDLPRRPNGEQVFLPHQRPRGGMQNQGERSSGSEAPRSVWPETPEEREAKQIRRIIEQARKDLIARVSISQNLGEVLTNLAKRTDDFAGKAEVQEIYEAMIIQERIETIQRNITESHNVELI